MEPTHLKTSKSLLVRLRDLEDQEAWSHFVDRYGPEIYRWCRDNQLQESDARDLTQEVLRKLVSAMRTFRYQPERGSFRGWLKTVTNNAVRDLSRKWEHRIAGTGNSSVNNFLMALAEPQNANSLEQKIQAQHDKEILAEAESIVKSRIQSKTWLAFEMSAVQNIPSREVADTLGISISDVYVSKCRVLKMLREVTQKLDQE